MVPDAGRLTLLKICGCFNAARRAGGLSYAWGGSGISFCAVKLNEGGHSRRPERASLGWSTRSFSAASAGQAESSPGAAPSGGEHVPE
jgi:hypothetical protein